MAALRAAGNRGLTLISYTCRVVELRGVAKSFGRPAPRQVLRDVSLHVAPGEYVAIVGASGVGKSTLLNVVAGLESIDAGRVLVDGVDLATLDDDRKTVLRRERIGFVFQAFHLLPYLSVGDNVALPLALLGRRGAQDRARVHAMLDAVGLRDRDASSPAELSGGELQRVAIARALVHRPSLVLADEPTGNLDPGTAHQVIEVLAKAIREGGASGIVVTHSPAAAASADRVYRLTPEGLHPVENEAVRFLENDLRVQGI
jgi:putative ABC transport system ATP-binding protein